MAKIVFNDPMINAEMRRRARFMVIFSAFLALSIAMNVGLSIKLIQARHEKRIAAGEFVVDRASVWSRDPHGRPPMILAEGRQ